MSKRSLINSTLPVVSKELIEVAPARIPDDGAFNPSLNGSGGQYRDRQVSQLQDYWRAVRKHVWLVIGVSILIPTMVAIYEIRKPDVYEAQARIQVDLERPNSLLAGVPKNGSMVLQGETNDPAYFNTQLQILVGPGLLRKVVKAMDLEHNQDFLRDYPAKGKSIWSDLRRMAGLGNKGQQNTGIKGSADLTGTVPGTGSSTEEAEAERLSDYVEDLQTGLKVEPVKETRLTVRETRLIDVSYLHTDPRLAARIVNTISDTFVLSNLETKTENGNTTGAYLQRRIAELQSQIRSEEEQLINYAKSHQILSLDEKQNTVVERLEGLNKQLLEAENERKMAESAYRASQAPGAAEALAEGGNGQGRDTPSATRLSTDAETKLTDLRQRRAELLVENTEKWPAVREIDKQIAVLEKQVRDTRSRAISTVTSNLATRYRQALATEQALRKAYDQQRSETLTQNEAAVNYRIIRQEIDTNKGLLDGLLQRTKENDVVTAGTPNNIRVIDQAIPPKLPVSPRRTLVVLLSLILSVILGVGLAFLLEFLDDTMRSAEDVEDTLYLPALAIIPQVEGARAKRFGTGRFGNRLLGSGSGNSPALLLEDLPSRDRQSEAYRQLRTSVLLSTAGNPPKAILITSSVPSEGKTTTAVNIAISLAQTGVKVLLIDADLRRPRLHSIFGVDNSRGLSTILSSQTSEAEALSMVHQHEATGLYVLTSGPVPPNPAELVGSEQMLNLVSRSESSFTHIVIDSPPITAFTDGVLIGAMVDGVLLVVQGGVSSRKVVQRSKKLLQDVGARIIGVVLNKVEVGTNGHYYYKSYYQNDSYAEDAAKET